MKIKGVPSTIMRGAILLFVLVTGGIANPREKRGLKDPFPKDDISSKFTLLGILHEKVEKLEETIEQDKDASLKQTQDFQIVIGEQTGVIKRLESAVQEMQSTMEEHGELLNGLSLAPGGDNDNYFAYSNHTCGGVLVAQTGYLMYDYEEHRAQPRPTNCMWTIRVNNYGNVKISTLTLERGSNQSPNSANGDVVGPSRQENEAYAVELVPERQNGNNGTETLKITTTRLRPQSDHVLIGPVVYIVYSMGQYEEAYANVNFNLRFEAVGSAGLKNVTKYTHTTLPYKTSTTLTDIDLAVATRSSEVDFSKAYTSLMVSNFSTKVWLYVDFNSSQCDKEDQFLLFVNSLASDQFGKDCCKTNCSGEKIIYKNPALILIKNRIAKPLKFILKFQNEHEYHSDSSFVRHKKEEYVGTPCGETLGGYFGQIHYKPTTAYEDNERCIWTIIPQPVPKAEIRISLSRTGVEPYHDHLYAMELRDLDGNMLPDAPKITPLTSLGGNNTYTARSREVYIVFYSDETVAGTGFSISYEIVGELVTSGLNVASVFDLFKHQKERDGYGVAFLLSKNRPSYRSIAITDFREDTQFNSILKVNLGSGTLVPGTTDRECTPSSAYTVFTTVKGVFKRVQKMVCDDRTQVVVPVPESMVLVMMNNSAGEVDAINTFRYEKVLTNETKLTTTDQTKCGGVIEEEKGMIRYKTTEQYLPFESCIWLIHSPNRSRIDLTLMKNGFEECCDFIVVSTVNPQTGLAVNVTKLTSRNKVASVASPIVVIGFQSDGSSSGNGFVLKFESRGEPSTDYNYVPVHKSSSWGRFTNPTADLREMYPGRNTTSQNILVFAYSPQVSKEGDESLRHVRVNLKVATFAPLDNDSCQFESVKVYTLEHGINVTKALPQHSGRTRRIRSFDSDEYNYASSIETTEEPLRPFVVPVPVMTEVPQAAVQEVRGRPEPPVDRCRDVVSIPEIPDWFQTSYASFLAIHKYRSDSSGGISFDWKKDSDCGGVVIGASGEILYKEMSSYNNYERCIWLVEVPRARSVEFVLEKNGFEDCCDYLLISSIDSDSVVPGPTVMMASKNQSTVVQGSVMIVAFVSDGSVTGTGFRLSYKLSTTRTIAPPFTFRLAHKALAPTNYSFAVGPSEALVVAQSAHKYATYYSGDRVAKNLRLTLKTFRPQVSPSCASDSLIIYKFPQKTEGVLTFKEYSASDVYPSASLTRNSEGQCNLIADTGDSYCGEIESCRESSTADTPLYSETGSFIAIYKSVASYSLNFSSRGFILQSGIVPVQLAG